MADNWYYAQDGKEHGPYSVVQLRELAASGGLQTRDSVWREGMATKVPAGRVKNLFADGALPQAAAEVAEAPVPFEEVAPPVEPVAVEEIAFEEPPVVPYFFDVPENAILLSLEGTPWVTAPVESQPVAPPPAEKKAPAAPKPEVRKKTVLRIKGGDVLSQDGAMVKFRKKCVKCGKADSSIASLPIRGGIMRTNFFCPNCKRAHEVELHCGN